MGAEVRRPARWWARWLAVGLAAAWAAVWLVHTVTNMPGDFTLTGVARGLLGLLLRVAVPAVGAWLAARRDASHVSLGLAVIAASGAAYQLAHLVAPWWPTHCTHSPCLRGWR